MDGSRRRGAIPDPSLHTFVLSPGLSNSVVSRVSSGSSSPVVRAGFSIQFWGPEVKCQRSGTVAVSPQWPVDPNLPSFPLSFMNVLYASVVLPAHLIWSSLATICLSFHIETMFRVIQPSSQATDWPWGARGTGTRAKARAGARGGRQTWGSWSRDTPLTAGNGIGF